jgi:hypothetical protein
MPSLLELQDLYSEALVRELIEKTKSAGVIWTHVGGTQFKCNEIQTSACVDPETADINWDFYISKTQVGSVSYKYTLDVKKNSVNLLTVENGPLPHTARDSVVKELYEIVEIIVLELDAKLKDAIRFIQDLKGALDDE